MGLPLLTVSILLWFSLRLLLKVIIPSFGLNINVRAFYNDLGSVSSARWSWLLYILPSNFS